MPTKSDSAAATSSTTDYLIERPNEVLRITVPSDWKVTFGPMVPGPMQRSSEIGPNCLRFYESKDKQRAIFTNVLSFRDMSIPLAKVVPVPTEQAR